MHGSQANSQDAKTNAFASMSWLCPTGVVVMTFPDKYKVEFYSTSDRILIVGGMYSREYIPMMSGNDRRYTIIEAEIGTTVVAILTLAEHIEAITWNKGRIDFGATMREMLNRLGGDEYAVALGVYDCSLEIELVHAYGDVRSRRGSSAATM